VPTQFDPTTLMQRSALPPILIAMGIILIIAGLLLWSGALGWFGRLPGDIRIERPNLSIHVPLVSMLIVSAAFSVVVSLVRKFWP
jgi:hypothetical protein